MQKHRLAYFWKTFLHSLKVKNVPKVRLFQNVTDYSLIILLFMLSLLIYVKLNKIVQKEKSSNLQILETLLTSVTCNISKMMTAA